MHRDDPADQGEEGRQGVSEEMNLAPAEYERMDAERVDIFAAIDAHARRGGVVVFWVCPNGCRDFVDWNTEGEKPVATCRKCGASNTAAPSKERET